MLPLEKLQKGAQIGGLLADGPATVVGSEWIGANTVEIYLKNTAGKVENRLLGREDEASLTLLEPGANWGFDSDGAMFRLVSEARRIQLAHLFDPVLAVQP
jgi:hypothetical protein